jgi:hypothetical protein
MYVVRKRTRFQTATPLCSWNPTPPAVMSQALRKEEQASTKGSRKLTRPKLPPPINRSSSKCSHCTSHCCISATSTPLLWLLAGRRTPPELVMEAEPVECGLVRSASNRELMSDSTGSYCRLHGLNHKGLRGQ